jgi:hypothetical protein
VLFSALDAVPGVTPASAATSTIRTLRSIRRS